MTEPGGPAPVAVGHDKNRHRLLLAVGVFIAVTLRYLFSARWNFEAQNATTGSRAGFNYRFEK